MIRMNARSGLTLVEMLVVLAILATVATVAVVSTEGLVDQSRYDSASRHLGQISEAIVGRPDVRQSDGTTLVSGFVADMGRLPKAVGSDPATQLQELWLMPAGALSFDFRSPAGDTTISVAGGWRGPYLSLPFSGTSLKDAWGRNLDLLKADLTTLVGNTEDIEAVRSLGANGAVDGTEPFDPDIYQVFNRTTPVEKNHLGSIQINVDVTGTPVGSNLVVRLYGPSGSNGNAVTLRQAIFPTGSQMVTWTDIPVGPRVIRAYETNDNPVGLPEQPIALSRASVAKSVVISAKASSTVPLKIE